MAMRLCAAVAKKFHYGLTSTWKSKKEKQHYHKCTGQPLDTNKEKDEKHAFGKLNSMNIYMHYWDTVLPIRKKDKQNQHLDKSNPLYIEKLSYQLYGRDYDKIKRAES